MNAVVYRCCAFSPLPCPLGWSRPWSTTICPPCGGGAVFFGFRGRLFLVVVLFFVLGRLCRLGLAGPQGVGAALGALRSLRVRPARPGCFGVLWRGRCFRWCFGFLRACAARAILEQTDTRAVECLLVFDGHGGGRGSCCRILAVEALLPHELAKLVFWQLKVRHVGGVVAVAGVGVFGEGVLVLALVEGVELVQLVQLLPYAGDARVRRVFGREAVGAHVVVYADHAEVLVEACGI
jgi:hypothetical protein